MSHAYPYEMRACVYCYTHPLFLDEAARRVVAQDGYRGLFGRGLKTRIIANGLQGLLFSILWKLFLDL